jgi:hypothetical protein
MTSLPIRQHRPSSPSSPRARELERRTSLAPLQQGLALAARQHRVIGREQLYALGVTRSQVRAELRGRRWQKWGRQVLVTHTGPLDISALRWAALLTAGPRGALDGTGALLAAGLRHWREEDIRVSVPRGARIRREKGIDVRQTRRWDAGDIVDADPPRMRNEVAAVRAALWARSDRAAMTLLTMVVQQGMTTAEQLGVEALRIKRDRRRRLVHATILDLLGGAQSLGELDFARLCRERGLPEPSRQRVREGANGQCYLDVDWERWRVVAEIDGIQHFWAQHVVDDALRHNSVTLTGDVVLRIPVLGLRVDPDRFLDQVERALRERGCTIPRRAA